MNAINSTFVTAACRFGNEGERGFKPSQLVTIIHTQNKGAFSERYLVLDASENKLGVALWTGEMYECTNARKISEDWSVERSLESLGFPEVDPTRIKTILGWATVQG